MRFFGFAILAMSAVCAGENKLNFLDEPSANDGVEIEVTPRALDFGALTASDAPVLRTFTIASTGPNPLEIETIEIIGDQGASFTIITPELNFELDSGETKDIEVSFSPLDANAIYAEALIESNAGNEPQATVDLVAEGLIGALAISPNPYDYGIHNVGCPVDSDFTITNVGSDDVTISEINQFGNDFTLSNPNILPITLAPEQSIDVEMSFIAMEQDQVASEIHVVSDEPMGTRVATQTGAGNITNQITQEWEFAVNPASDIMFSVDASCSMSNNTQQLASNFSTFMSQLSNYTNDWQVMVTGGDTGCNAGGILTPQTPNYASIFQNAVRCKENPLVSNLFWNCDGMGGDYTEALLTEARNAVENTDAGECNAGFIREEALLHIVLVSDEPEQSDLITGETWQQLSDQIIAKRGSAGMVRISSIVGDAPDPNDPNDQGGCESGGLFGSDAVAGTGYTDATDYTGGVFLSICDNWASGNNLQLLAEASVLLEAYPLDYQALEESITVMVNGYEVTANNWHYDSATQSVVFDANPPAEGATVTITYSPIGVCE
jgi:hypothetical protein